MIPLHYASKSQGIDVDLTGCILGEMLDAYTDKEDISPFSRISWDTLPTDLPTVLFSSEVKTLEVHAAINFVEEKEKVSFWKLDLYCDTEVQTYSWYCYIIIESTSFFDCRRQISQFLNNQLHLRSYVSGKLFNKRSISDISKHLIAGDDDKQVNELKIVPSEN